jgi:KEOPS complex subunit Cgi121
MIESDILCQIRYATAIVQDVPAVLSKLRTIAGQTRSRIVCFDAEKLAGRKHAQAALYHAQRSCSSGCAISNSFEMEALLYAAGTRQCSVAVSFGLHVGKNNLFVCCYPAPQGVWDRLAGILQFCNDPGDIITSEKAVNLANLFGISPEELAVTGKDRIKDLVLERVALLNVSK